MTSRSPLHDYHQRLGARFVDFGGWEMPVQFGSVLTEHRAVREAAGWFDVSHLGRFSWRGPGAAAALSGLFCNDLERIGPGETQYTMLLNDRGGVVDDIVVWRWEAESFFVLPNAANHEKVMAAAASAAPQVELRDLRPVTVMLAVQGPRAPGLLEAVVGRAPKRFRTIQTSVNGEPVWMAGTGYTGERGGELVASREVALELATMLVEAGATPCGLGARDTLRLEAGLPLWGQDLDPDTTPIEAGLEFAVSFDHDFVGKDALTLPPTKRAVAFEMPDRRIPRHGYRLQAGESAGVVTSGNFSPMLEKGIGIGYLSPPNLEDPLEVEVRGEWIAARRVQPPFYRR
jgi:aminomethyltransferase